MIVIINSDILYHQYLISERFSPSFERLLDACAQGGHEVLIPETALLEFRRSQAEFAAGQRSKLQNAYRTLTDLGVVFQRQEPDALIREPDLMALLVARGVRVATEIPTLADYGDAHRRACLHQAPHPAQSKSDEMRDLVIWAIALRVAAGAHGAVLLSRDDVHSGVLGDTEAAGVHLVRVRSCEEALEFFQVKTPAGEMATAIMALVWPELVGAGLPLPVGPSVTGISGVRFVHGQNGPRSAMFSVKARSDKGGDFGAKVGVEIEDGVVSRVGLSDVRVDEERWRDGSMGVVVKKPLPGWADDYQERLAALRGMVV